MQAMVVDGLGNASQGIAGCCICFQKGVLIAEFHGYLLCADFIGEVTAIRGAASFP